VTVPRFFICQIRNFPRTAKMKPAPQGTIHGAIPRLPRSVGVGAKVKIFAML
jgi:hypothetical protein